VASALAIMMTWYREMVVRLSERSERLGLSLLSLEAANRSYQEYAERVERLSEDKERNRITREIHDTIGYALTNIGMMLQACKAIARKDFERLEELLDLAREQAKTALQESRNILYKLRVTPREAHYGLAAVQRLARSLRDATGLDVDVSFGNITEGFGPGVDSAVFRLVQEGITNAIKHGTARQIRISYWLTPEGLTVRIWDDGEGSAEVGEGIGLAGMRERFAAFGGSVEAGNALNGFALSGFIPAAVLGHEDGIPEEQDQNPHRR
jgi:signal transduction histidine kinase